MTGQQINVNDNANQFAQQQQPPAQQQQPPAQQQTQQPPAPAPMAQAFNPSFVSFNTTAPQQQASTPPTNPYQAIIDQQQEQINALMQQNGALTGQISQMVQNGYQVNTQPAQQVQQVQQAPHVGQNWAVQPQTQFAPVYMPDNAPISLTQDVSLEGLAKDIGKKEGE